MSKRAEEAALKRYPEERQFFDSAFGRMTFDHNAPKREGFIQGYKQAEKDAIERAIAWLKANAVNYIYNCTDPYPDALFRVAIGGKCWEDLEKAMEEE